MARKRGLVAALLVVVLGTITGCGWLEDLFNPPLIPVPANIYAISVEAYNICTRNNRYCDPQRAVGPPDETSPWKGRFVSLGGKGGYIIALMSAEFTDGPGEDLRIYEVGKLQGGRDEPFDVFISSDRIIWIQVADDTKNDSGKVYASIDIAPYTGPYKYVKVVDESTHTSGTPPGSDIDAIEALWAAGSSTTNTTFMQQCINQLGRWPDDTVRFYILSRGDEESIPPSWMDGILQAAETWNRGAQTVGSAFRFVYVGLIDEASTINPEKVNVIKIDPALDKDNELGRGTIAGYESSQRLEMVFNRKRVSAGTVQAVALHEFGHWTGRGHPPESIISACSAFTVMAGVFADTKDLKEADLLGLKQAYGQSF